MKKGTSQGIRWPMDVWAELREVSNWSGLTISDLVRVAVMKFLREVKEKKAIELQIASPVNPQTEQRGRRQQ